MFVFSHMVDGVVNVPSTLIVSFAVAVAILVLVAIRCNTKMRYEKLKLGYDLISKDVTAEALAGFLGEPSSQFVGNGTLSYHYAFWRGIRRGVYIYTFSIVTHKLQTREMKWL